MPDALDLLRSRNSTRAQDLGLPAPTGEQLNAMLEIAARVPDHGMLKPWRFIVHPRETRAALVDKLTENFCGGNPNASAQEIDKQRLRFGESPLIVTVVSKAAPHPKIPEIEQLLSAAAACMNLLHAAHAMGFGANWLTGWAAFDPGSKQLFGLKEGEQIVGFIHIGTPKAAPFERPRPDLSEIVTTL